MLTMVQGSKNSKLSEGSNKTPETSIPPKLYQKNKTFPEKTKFTLQYNTINSQQVKITDKKELISVTPRGSRILRNTKANLSIPGVEDIRVKTSRDQKLSQRDFKRSQLSDGRKISSSPFLIHVSDNKSNVASARRLTTTSAPTETPIDSKNNVLRSKQSSGSVQKCNPLKNKTEHMSMGKTETSSKLNVCSSGVKLKEPGKSIKSVNSSFKKATTSYRLPESHAIIEEVRKTENKALPNSLDRDRRNCIEQDGKVITKQRSRSQEVKLLPKESSVKHSETEQRKRSDENILLNELNKKLSFSGLSERVWEAEGVALDVHENPLSHNSTKGCIKENVKYSAKISEDLFKSSKIKSNATAVTDRNGYKQYNVVQNYPPNPSEDYDAYGSLERRRRDEERLNLDKRIWSNLEVRIKETCEKTDFLYDSEDESGESISDIIHQLFSNRDDEDLIKFFKTSKVGNCTDHREERGELNIESKVRPGHGNGFYENHKAKAQVVSKTKDCCDRSKLRRGIEEIFDKKICQESMRTKSSENSKIMIAQQEYRTKSLSGDIKWTNSHEDSQGKVSKERKTVNFRDDKLGDKCVSSSFFNSHKNVGFIGRDVDEDYVSFESGQVTLYQPHEGQMLLYDIANCAATQGYLKMCGITYDVVTRKNAEQMSPSGRVPFISSSLCIIPEFEAIVSFLQYKKFAFIPVKERDQPVFRAIISKIVDILETAERYICWYDDTTLLNYTRPRIVGQYPFPLNHIMHWKKRQEERCRLVERGYTGRSLDVILGEINSCFRMLSRRLGNNDFFFGGVGTEVDALVYGHVYALFTAEVDGPLRDLQFIIQRYPNLVSFACNFDKMFSLDKFSSIRQSYWDNVAADGECSNDKSDRIT